MFDHQRPRPALVMALADEGLLDSFGVSAALRCGAHQLLLIGYKGADLTLRPTTTELVAALSILTGLGRAAEAVIAADDYTRRRLSLVETCGDDYVRVALDGIRDHCCFPDCEYRD